MKFGHLVKYGMRNIFLEKSKSVVEKLVPDPFLKNHNWAYLWINTVWYSLHVQIKVYP